MLKHIKIKVVGKVQGVYFRASTKTEADRIGIVGIVRNEKDGSVYIEAEGEEKALDEFLQWCRKGSTMANVSSLNFESGEIKNFKTFDVVRM